jgi:hypothetical protein
MRFICSLLKNAASLCSTPSIRSVAKIQDSIRLLHFGSRSNNAEHSLWPHLKHEALTMILGNPSSKSSSSLKNGCRRSKYRWLLRSEGKFAEWTRKGLTCDRWRRCELGRRPFLARTGRGWYIVGCVSWRLKPLLYRFSWPLCKS